MSYKTCFRSVAEKIKNYCDIELGIHCYVYYINNYYILNIQGTEQELEIVSKYINDLEVINDTL